MKRISIYIHVPFCLSKCGYCDFYSIPHDEAKVRAFLGALEKEIAARLPEGAAADTIYIGGGTPTVLDTDDLERLMAIVTSRAAVDKETEFTIEANPDTVSEAKMAALVRAGVNRVSLGAQSFNDGFLKLLGRTHDFHTTLDAVNLVGDAGIENLSLDIIAAIPGETVDDVIMDLNHAALAGARHMSVYLLSFEEGTPFAKRLAAGELEPVGEEVQVEMFYRAKEFLFYHGFAHYEISNYARQGFESRHNINYWTGGEYYGFGPSAASYIGGVRSKNVADAGSYTELASRGEPAFAESEKLEGRRRAAELLITRLRTIDGVPGDWLKETTGFGLEEFSGAIEKLAAQGLLVQSEGRISLSRRGLIVSDGVFAEFL